MIIDILGLAQLSSGPCYLNSVQDENILMVTALIDLLLFPQYFNHNLLKSSIWNYLSNFLNLPHSLFPILFSCDGLKKYTIFPWFAASCRHIIVCSSFRKKNLPCNTSKQKLKLWWIPYEEHPTTWSQNVNKIRTNWKSKERMIFVKQIFSDSELEWWVIQERFHDRTSHLVPGGDRMIGFPLTASPSISVSMDRALSCEVRLLNVGLATTFKI